MAGTTVTRRDVQAYSGRGGESHTVTSFDNLGDYVAMPRLTGLRLAPDGSWLAATVQALSLDGKKFCLQYLADRHRPPVPPRAMSTR